MRITYDHQAFSTQKYGGVSRYFYEIAKRINEFDGYDVSILSPFFLNNYLKNDQSIKVWGRYGNNLPKPGRIAQKLNERLVCWKLHREPPDIVHETYYFPRKLASSKTKAILTVYDMIHENFPQCFPPSDRTVQIKKAAVGRADHIICISESTRSDLIKILGVDRQKTSVIYLAHTATPRKASQTPPITDRSYIAYVGARGGYKNFSGLLSAFRASEFLKNNFSIVCFGGGDFTRGEHEEIVRAGLMTEQVIHTKGSDEALGAVDRGAAAFVCPSLYEGFGLPPLEAMSEDCPVVCSKTSSLPEVCGDAAEYFDPYQPEAIAFSIEQATASPSRRHELIALGRQRIKNFSWDTCAKQTAAIYDVVSNL
jgi:glycosyltransferase involved in cell wall biosynthesis